MSGTSTNSANDTTGSSNPEILAQPEESSESKDIQHVRIAILGTGFSGLGMAIRLKQRGEENFVVFEKATDIGGTWRDNTYPGCACDVPSHLYSFSFALNPRWSHAFSRQPEIWEYLRDCARRFGITPHIRWNTELLSASWNEEEQCWHILTSRGPYTAEILIMGNGPLSEPSLPPIKGIENFEGTLFHSARWDHSYDLNGKRVAVIGTGASAIQFVPRIQPQVAQLSLFMRTPPWIIPRLDHPIPGWQQKLFRWLPFIQRAIRSRIYLLREITALAFIYRPKMLKAAMRIGQEHLEKQVPDPGLRAKLTPTYTLGCKRVLLSDDFYPSLSQPNVEVVTDHIREVRAHSIVTEDGKEHEIDALICATGFHVTDTHLPEQIYGRDGQSLGESWQAGPNAYLGAAVAGFPNLFLLVGPNTGLGHTSMIYMIESQLNYILDGLRVLKQRNLRTLEIRPNHQEAYNTEIQKRMQGTVWTSGCSSWYLDRHGHNTTIWPGFTFEFRHRTRHFDAQHYKLQARKAPTQSQATTLSQSEVG